MGFPTQGFGYWDPYGNFWNGNQGMYQQGYGQGASYNVGYNANQEINYVGDQGNYNFVPSYPTSNQYQNQGYPSFYNNQPNYPSADDFQGYNYQEENSAMLTIILGKLDQLENKGILKRRGNLELTREAPPPPKETTFFPSNPIVNPKAPPSNTLQVANDNEDEGEEVDWYGVGNLKGGSNSRQGPIISLKVEPALPQAPIVKAKIEIAPMPIHGSIVEKNRWRMTEMAKLLDAMPFREALATYPLFFSATTETNNDTQDVDEGVSLVDEVEEPTDEVETLEDEIAEVETVEKVESVKDLLNNGDDLEQLYSRLAFAKAILANKEEVEQLIKDIESPNESLKVLEKKGSPGMFSIKCALGDCVFDGAFCDSGSYVSVISSHLASVMKLDGMQRCSSLVTFGDQSRKRPKGIFKDFPIKVGNCLVPTDLLVLDMVDEGNQSLLLGIPFLLTVGAKMDYVNRVVSFDNIDKHTFYPLDNNGRNLVGAILKQEPIFTINATSENAQDIPQVDPPKVTSKKKAKAKEKTKANAGLGKGNLTKSPPSKAEHSPIIFVPTMLANGKLECKVRTRHGVSPFAKARIVLGSTSHVKEGHLMSEKMATLFNMKLVDYGPQPPCPPPLEN